MLLVQLCCRLTVLDSPIFFTSYFRKKLNIKAETAACLTLGSVLSQGIGLHILSFSAYDQWCIFLKPKTASYPTIEAHFKEMLCISEGALQVSSARKTLLAVCTIFCLFISGKWEMTLTLNCKQKGKYSTSGIHYLNKSF